MSDESNKKSLVHIDLKCAKDLTANWRARFSLDPGEVPVEQTFKNAFLVSKEDLHDITHIKGYQGMRVYFGSDTINSMSPMRLVLVAVDENGNDIIDYNNPDRPGIFDFSMPCPDTCDRKDSVLMTGRIPPHP